MKDAVCKTLNIQQGTSFSNAYPIVFDGCIYKSKEGPRSEIIIIRAKDRHHEKLRIEDLLVTCSVNFVSRIEPSITRNIETLVTINASKITKLGFKPLGSSAMGIGAQITTTGEQAQTIYCALAQDKLSLDYPDVVKNFSKSQQYFRINDPPQQTLKKISRQWQLSCAKTAQVLQKEVFDGKGRYVFHRGTPTVDRINAVFQRTNKLLDPAIQFAKLDKWNPSDIWAIKSNCTLQLAQIKSIEELNGYLREQMKQGILFGISLKMSVNPTIEHVNQLTAQHPTFKYVKSIVSNAGKTILTSKSAYIFGSRENKEYKIEIRSHKNLTSFNAEIKGTTANHGKISYDRLVVIIKEITGNSLPPRALGVRDQVLQNNEAIIKFTYDKAKEIQDPGVTWEQYQQEMITKESDWIWSRYLGVLILNAFHITSQDKQNRLFQSMMSYMSSTRELSAPFIKVS